MRVLPPICASHIPPAPHGYGPRTRSRPKCRARERNRNQDRNRPGEKIARNRFEIQPDAGTTAADHGGGARRPPKKIFLNYHKKVLTTLQNGDIMHM